jgi:hypothetical protein
MRGLSLCAALLLLSSGSNCTLVRNDPPGDGTPTDPPRGSGGNGGTGAGGSGGTGATSAGGSGGTGATGAGANGTGASGVGGSDGLNEVADLLPFCGCITDSKQPGACGNCYPAPATAGTCADELAGCAQPCLDVLNHLENVCGAVIDVACLQAAYAIAPDAVDDAVAVLTCRCTTCSFECDATACQ